LSKLDHYFVIINRPIQLHLFTVQLYLNCYKIQNETSAMNLSSSRKLAKVELKPITALNIFIVRTGHRANIALSGGLTVISSVRHSLC